MARIFKRSEMEKYYKAYLADNAQKPSAEQSDICRLNILKQMIDDEDPLGSTRPSSTLPPAMRT